MIEHPAENQRFIPLFPLFSCPFFREGLKIADNRFDRAELDWLLYNKPLEYADLVLNGGIEEYCKTSREHSTIED